MEETNSLQNTNNLEVSDKGSGFLLEAAKWGKFLGIVGFVLVGITVIAAFIAGIAWGSIPQKGMQMPFQSFLITGIYLIMALLYFFPILYLHQFSIKTIDAIENGDNAKLETGMEKLKSLFKFMGIFTIVMIGINALALIAFVVADLFLN